MKALPLIAVAATAALFLPAVAQEAAFSSPSDKLSYAIGASAGKNLRVESPDINLDLVIQGLRAGFEGQGLRISDKDLRLTLSEYQTQLRRRAIELRQQAVVENRKKGEAYLTENREKPGVKVLPSGVQYSVVKAGDGPVPKESDTVVVHYAGSLINGREFDSTDANRPLSLRVGTLIPGWRDALLAMPVGSKWHLVIPSDLGYGDRGIGDIGPNEVLVFDVELLAIR